MADLQKFDTDPAGALFDAVEGIHAGMLGIAGSTQHAQPMSQFVDRDAQALYFLTSRDTDLVTAIGAGAEARFVVVSENKDFWSSIAGPIAPEINQAKIEELWSPAVGAWFEGGPTDPQVALLRMTIAQAAVWASTGNALRFGFEMVRAMVQKDAQPDVGLHKVYDFPPRP